MRFLSTFLFGVPQLTDYECLIQVLQILIPLARAQVCFVPLLRFYFEEPICLGVGVELWIPLVEDTGMVEQGCAHALEVECSG